MEMAADARTGVSAANVAEADACRAFAKFASAGHRSTMILDKSDRPEIYNSRLWVPSAVTNCPGPTFLNSGRPILVRVGRVSGIRYNQRRLG
jgi:hypothetical protein